MATSPAGPFTKDPGNPGVINGTGAPAADADLFLKTLFMIRSRSITGWYFLTRQADPEQR